MRENKDFSMKEKLGIVYRLSMPGILAQISEIIMQYIDAAMVGTLGAAASASIGLVSSSTWLFGGLIMAAASGFSVQVAHASGAGDHHLSRMIFKQSLLASFLYSLIVAALGSCLAFVLPQWLGAEEAIWYDARMYFLFFSLFLPVRMINNLCMNMLQCAGNMKVPSICASFMCLMDVVFNFLLIFPSRSVSFGSFSMYVYGAGLGVTGAQLGTSFAFVCSMVILLFYAIRKEDSLKLTGNHDSWLVRKDILKRAFEIGGPLAMEQSATTGAQVVSTKIVAPLGTIAIAANSFAVTAESICYMPGYGIGSAATTMVGQAIGAKRKDLARSFAWLATGVGILVQSLMGVLMYFLCPFVFSFLTPVAEVQELGIHVLRIELFAEALFAASIVATGALRGAGDTFVPGLLNLVSIWGVRITMAYFLSKIMGLTGVWIAMAVELSCRGVLLLIRLKQEKWLKKIA